jgi:hypothetical protein
VNAAGATPEDAARVAALGGDALTGAGHRLLALGPGAGALARSLPAQPEVIEELPPAPPLPHDARAFDLILAPAAFSAPELPWAAWLAELHRLLAPGGAALVGLAGTRAFEERLFEIAAFDDRGDRTWVALRPLSGAAELEEQRLAFDRELKRKAFRIAELELGRTPTPSYWANAERVSAEYEATLSWRVTRPLRAVKRILARS